MELVTRFGAWNRCGIALEHAGVEIARIILGVAISQVQLVGIDALADHFLDQCFGLIEGNHQNRVGVGGFQRGHQ